MAGVDAINVQIVEEGMSVIACDLRGHHRCIQTQTGEAYVVSANSLLSTQLPFG